MTWTWRAAAALLGVCLSGSAALGAAARDAQDALVVEFLDLSGTRRMLEQVPQQVLASAAKDQERLPAATRARLQPALAEAYRFDALYRTVYADVRRRGSANELAAALELLRSPVALRFTEWEVEAGTPEAQPLFQAYVNALPSSPPERERVALVERLDGLTGTSAALTDVTVQTAGAIARGVASARGPLTHAQRAALEDAMTQMRQRVGPACRQQVLALLLFTYRKATVAELARYVQLFDGGTGAWISQVTGAALRAGLERAASELARLLAGSGVLAPAH